MQYQQNLLESRQKKAWGKKSTIGDRNALMACRFVKTAEVREPIGLKKKKSRPFFRAGRPGRGGAITRAEISPPLFHWRPYEKNNSLDGKGVGRYKIC